MLGPLLVRPKRAFKFILKGFSNSLVAFADVNSRMQTRFCPLFSSLISSVIDSWMSANGTTETTVASTNPLSEWFVLPTTVSMVTAQENNFPTRYWKVPCTLAG